MSVWRVWIKIVLVEDIGKQMLLMMMVMKEGRSDRVRAEIWLRGDFFVPSLCLRRRLPSLRGDLMISWF